MDFSEHRRHSRHGMANDSFKGFVLDQLAAIPELRVKRMFGGHGLYQANRFFGILMDGRLYFKTDEQTRAAYVEREMSPFIYERARRIVAMRYFEVPPSVLEDRGELVVWAMQSIRAAMPASEKSFVRPAKKPSKKESRNRGLAINVSSDGEP